MTSSDSTPTKACCKCSEELPCTSEFFPIDKRRPAGLASRCRKCWNEDARAYRALHPAKNNPEYRRRYREANKEKIKEYRREYIRRYRREHPEKRLAERQRYAEKYPNRRKEYYQEHIDMYHETNKRYRKQNREKCRIFEHQRRARKAGSAGSHTAADIRLLIKTQKNLCWWCGKKVDPKNFHVDHRIPLSRGGSNAPENLCIACPACNLSKHNKLPQEWSGSLL